MLASLLLLLQAGAPDTLEISTVSEPPVQGRTVDSARYGSPQVRVPTRQGVACVWLLRASDTVFVAVTIPDSTVYWGDDFVLSFDTRGDGGMSPQHDDFQWYLRRTTDSSLVYRGRSGRWEPPKGDPDWRLGPDRAGGGWELSPRDGSEGWSILLRLDPAWFTGADGRLPRVAFRIFDNDPQGFFIWPAPADVPQPSAAERIPDMWAPIR